MLIKITKTTFIISIALLFLSSCSVYKVAYDFTPPKSKSGLVCLTKCQSQLKRCNLSCNQQYKHCGVKAGQTAKKRLPGLLAAYPRQLEAWLNAREEYRRELDWYEFRLDMAEARRDRYLDRCEKAGKKRHICFNGYRGYSFLHSRPHFNLPRPVKPTLAGETNLIRKETCTTDCACNSSYRSCYTSCGGVVKSKKVCVRNCVK